MALVFLDLDGTLTDPKPGITKSVVYALGQVGIPAPNADDLEWVIGPALIDSFARLGVPDPAIALDHYRARYSTDGIFDATVYDGIPAALSKMADAGHRLVLATAKPHIYARKITAHFGLDQFLDGQFGPELDGTRNDKCELLRYALAKMDLSANSAVMVGDRVHDMNAARGNDMRFAGVQWGYGTPKELSGADVLCHSPRELPSLIEGLFA